MSDRDALRDKIEDRLGHHPDCSRLDSRFDDDCDCGTWTRIAVVMEEVDAYASRVRADLEAENVREHGEDPAHA